MAKVVVIRKRILLFPDNFFTALLSAQHILSCEKEGRLHKARSTATQQILQPRRAQEQEFCHRSLAWTRCIDQQTISFQTALPPPRLVYRLMRRATSLTHTFEIKFCSIYLQLF